MKYFLLLFLLTSPVMAQEESKEEVSPFEVCLQEVRLRGGDAWAARNKRIPTEDCCPFEAAPGESVWCDEE